MCNLGRPMLERFVRVKTSTEASRDVNWDWSLRRPARPIHMVLPFVT